MASRIWYARRAGTSPAVVIRAPRIYEGASEIQRTIIARQLFS